MKFIFQVIEFYFFWILNPSTYFLLNLLVKSDNSPKKNKIWQLSYYIIFHDVPLNQILVLLHRMYFSSTWKFLTYIDIWWENDLLDLFMCWLWWIFMILLPVTKIKITSLYPSLSLDSKRLVHFFFSFFSCFYSLSFQFMWKNTQILWWLSFSTDKPFCCQS